MELEPAVDFYENGCENVFRMKGYPAVKELGLGDVLACLASDEERERVFRQGLRNNPRALVNLETRRVAETVLGRPISLGEVARRMAAQDEGRFVIRQ